VRKLAHIDAPPALVCAMFANLRRWTAWMPGVEAVSVLEESAQSAVALMRQRWIGRELSNKYSFVFGPDRVEQRQLAGPFRRWETHWRFLSPPDGRGTTVLVDIDFELPLLGRLAPRRLRQERLDRMFEEVIDKARARAREIQAGGTLSIEPPAAAGSEPAMLVVYQADRGLEIELGGRRYFLPRVRRTIE
jgi:ribosome-associated toxin RatA of RatAB toxin-antitoxin module